MARIEIQEQCWGKPALEQKRIWAQYGYIPSSHGWLYLPFKIQEERPRE